MERALFFKEQALALIFEVAEASHELSWKSWATRPYLNREAYIGEIVDVLHFAGNILVMVDCTDTELEEAYYEKMERNRNRMKSGVYTGTDKCPSCKRDWGDIKAHAQEGEVIRYMLQDTNGEGKTICSNCYFAGKARAQNS
jgi:hypothetical protein